MAKLTDEVQVATISEIEKPGGCRGGLAGLKSIVDFVKTWFATAQEHTSNFQTAPQASMASGDSSPISTKEAYERVAHLSPREFQHHFGDILAKATRTDEEKAQLRVKPVIQKLPSMDGQERLKS